jgi:hypothetical protein
MAAILRLQSPDWGPPPKQESKCVREIFSMVLQTRLGPREIARVAFWEMKSIQGQVTSETGGKAERVRNGAGRDILGEVNLPRPVIGRCQHVDIGDFTIRRPAFRNLC